ncbi:MAG: DoxX family protein [Candidatus Binatia bacterium]
MLVYPMGVLYVVAGITHFTNPGFFRQIVPPMLPAPALLVVVSGIAEISLGLLVMLPATRRFAAWGLVALLIAVYPANIYMAVSNLQLVDPPAWMGQPTPLGLWLRLPVQFLLMYWAWRYTR